ncbi:MAG: hypothetical protein FJX52_09920, partial [Alphaproteobacteria bacterium]|nr:hypothetical protein [Alphaproteobacteria bacterium]
MKLSPRLLLLLGLLSTGCAGNGAPGHDESQGFVGTRQGLVKPMLASTRIAPGDVAALPAAFRLDRGAERIVTAWSIAGAYAW